MTRSRTLIPTNFLYARVSGVKIGNSVLIRSLGRDTSADPIHGLRVTA
jgi:hypothetical protein